MAKRSFGSAFAAATDVTPCFGSAGTVIAVNAIAALIAGLQHVSSNGAAPTAAISGVAKDGLTIATGNKCIAAGRREHA